MPSPICPFAPKKGPIAKVFQGVPLSLEQTFNAIPVDNSTKCPGAPRAKRTRSVPGVQNSAARRRLNF